MRFPILFGRQVGDCPWNLRVTSVAVGMRLTRLRHLMMDGVDKTSAIVVAIAIAATIRDLYLS